MAPAKRRIVSNLRRNARRGEVVVLLAAALALIGWVGKGLVTDRILVLEQQTRATAEGLARIEGKIDALLDRRR